MRRILTGLMCLAVFSITAAGQQFWEKKPWMQWNKNEVQRMLNDSPWAQSQTLANVNVTLAGPTPLRGSAAASASDRDYADVTKVTYTAQFRSAQPLRQALVRQLQLVRNYDSLSPEQKKNFDGKTALFLQPSDPKQIVVFVGYEVSIPGYLIEVQRYWNAQSVTTLAPTVYLNLPGGHKLSLVDYSPAAGGFQFLVQRPDEPLPEGNITLQFDSPAFNNIPGGHVGISFTTRKMAMNGVTVF